MQLKDETVVVIGGGSGIGLAVARMAYGAGARIVLGGRDPVKLDRAVAEFDTHARAIPVDTADRASVDAFFLKVGELQHLLVTAASYSVVSIYDLDDEAAESPFRSKFWGQYRAVRAALPYLTKNASITLMAGAAGARPLKGAAAYAACNSAIEGRGRALAVELAPVRVNTVSPGTIDGSLWRGRSEEVRETVFAGWRNMALLGRTGTEDEVAQTILLLMANTFMTGSTLYPDGGFALK